MRKLSREMDPTTGQKKVKRDEENSDNPKPVEEETQQVAKTVSELPEEVLEMIFSYMKTSRDAHSVSNACPQFARIMSPTKPVWSFEQVFPLIFSELDKNDMLNCRLVCKQWNQAVDNTLQVCPRHRDLTLYPEVCHIERNNRPLHAPQFQTCLFPKRLHGLCFWRPFQIKSFMERMGDHPRNPFVLRRVGLANPENYEEFWELAISFLERFGTEIWHVHINSEIADPEEMPSRFSYELACQILGHLPNLQTLSVFGFIDGPSNSPVPQLPQLHTLALEFIPIPYNQPQPNLNELMRSHSSQLKLISLNDLSVGQIHNFPAALPQVTTIQLTIGIGVNRRSWRQFCHDLAAPKLAKFGIHMHLAWKMKDLLEPLSAANLQSVVYLNLRFYLEPDKNASLTVPQFTLPNIKTLEIMDTQNLQFNELFRHLPNLEYLLCHRQSLPKPNLDFDDPIQWHLFQWFNGESIYSSNIWTQLSALKELTLVRLGNFESHAINGIMDQKTFTRETYNRMREDFVAADH